MWRGDGRRGGHSLKPGIDGAETELNDKNDLNAISNNLLLELGMVLSQQKNLLPCGSKFFSVRAPSGINRIKWKKLALPFFSKLKSSQLQIGFHCTQPFIIIHPMS